MPRIAIGIEYEGTGFSGWQRQGHARSVQAELEAALSRVADHPVEITAAGRTDAGVHALQQVAHFDTSADREPRAWVLGTNTSAAPDVGLLWARPVPDDFHARHSAIARSYRYLILTRPVRPVMERARACWLRVDLDAGAMHQAAQALVGEHDFSAFRASQCQSPTPIRRLESVAVRALDGVYVEITVTANAFLHHMVRNIAGSLLAVGKGEQAVGWIAQVLAGRDRRLAGITAPPQGLSFLGPRYPAHLGLPEPPVPLRAD